MTALIDTSVLVDHLRGLPEARDVLGALVERGEPMVGTVLTRTEVLAGMRPEEFEPTTALLATVEWVPVDEPIADRAGELARRYLRSHPGVDTVDYVIAATAELRDAEVWTRNVKHFPMFPGLLPPY